MHDLSHLSVPDYTALEAKVLDWAKERNIGEEGPEHTFAQLSKVMEEAGEVEVAIATSENPDEIKMEIGDLIVTVILLCSTLGTTPAECLSMAYNKIKSRRGKTVDGVFYKEADLVRCSSCGRMYPVDLPHALCYHAEGN